MDIHVKWRPKRLDEVVGQEHIIDSLDNVLGKGTAHAFLLSGPTGVGKTTIARIIADWVGGGKDITEVDAATHSGVDEMRALAKQQVFSGWGKDGVRVAIIDECHVLSPTAWQSLQKPIEEPRQGAFWILCTTNKRKVPKTIQNRCVCYDLKPIPRDDIYQVITTIAGHERIKCKDEVFAVIVEQADGSLRRALTYLIACSHCKTRADAYQTMATADEESDEAFTLCRLLMKGASFSKVLGTLRGLEGVNAESCRMLIVRYFTSVVLGAKSDDKASRGLAVLEAFDDDCTGPDGMAKLLLAFGRLLL